MTSDSTDIHADDDDRVRFVIREAASRKTLTAILGFSDEFKARSDAYSIELLSIIGRNGSLLWALF